MNSSNFVIEISFSSDTSATFLFLHIFIPLKRRQEEFQLFPRKCFVEKDWYNVPVEIHSLSNRKSQPNWTLFYIWWTKIQDFWMPHYQLEKITVWRCNNEEWVVNTKKKSLGDSSAQLVSVIFVFLWLWHYKTTKNLIEINI